MFFMTLIMWDASLHTQSEGEIKDNYSHNGNFSYTSYCFQIKWSMRSHSITLGSMNVIQTDCPSINREVELTFLFSESIRSNESECPLNFRLRFLSFGDCGNSIIGEEESQFPVMQGGLGLNTQYGKIDKREAESTHAMALSWESLPCKALT